jgi:hypothetical protein
MIRTAHQILFGLSDQIERNGRGIWHVWETEEMHTEFLLGDLRERDHLEEPDIDGSFILRCIFSRNGMGVMGWVDLSQKRDRWRYVVNAVMNLEIP